MDTVVGRRNDLKEWSWAEGEGAREYDYGKRPDGVWYCFPPNLNMGSLAGHEVVENDDGTITVSPSILVEDYNGRSWHGFLERGVWRTA